MIEVAESQFLDPRWQLSNLYTITDKTGRQVPFRPNEAQVALLDDLHSANIILKARQLGFTTLCCLIYLDACVFIPNTSQFFVTGPEGIRIELQCRRAE